MKRAAILLCVALGACHRSSADPGGEVSAEAASGATSASAPVASALTPRVLHPPGGAASREDREAAARDLLSGKAHAAELPLADTDRGDPFEPGLRNMLQTRTQVRVGAVTASALDPEAVAKAIEGHLRRFRLCYAEGLRYNPNLTGRVTVRFVVNASGKPENLANAGSDMPDGAVTSCVVKTMGTLQIPAPQGLLGTATVPLLFSSGG